MITLPESSTMPITLPSMETTVDVSNILPTETISSFKTSPEAVRQPTRSPRVLTTSPSRFAYPKVLHPGPTATPLRIKAPAMTPSFVRKVLSGRIRPSTCPATLPSGMTRPISPQRGPTTFPLGRTEAMISLSSFNTVPSGVRHPKASPLKLTGWPSGSTLPMMRPFQSKSGPS